MPASSLSRSSIPTANCMRACHYQLRDRLRAIDAAGRNEGEWNGRADGSDHLDGAFITDRSRRVECGAVPTSLRSLQSQAVDAHLPGEPGLARRGEVASTMVPWAWSLPMSFGLGRPNVKETAATGSAVRASSFSRHWSSSKTGGAEGRHPECRRRLAAPQRIDHPVGIAIDILPLGDEEVDPKPIADAFAHGVRLDHHGFRALVSDGKEAEPARCYRGLDQGRCRRPAGQWSCDYRQFGLEQ